MEPIKKANIKVKINQFFRKNKKKIIIGLIIWSIIIIINYIIKYMDKKVEVPSTTYEPHVSVIDNTKSVPQNLQEPIEDIVQTYFNYCNNGEYENAYNLLTEDCKNNIFGGKVENFQKYVESIFNGQNKIYNIQNYSNVDKNYIYTIRILEDILATGTTNGYGYYEEKITMIQENGEIKLSVNNYIGSENMDVVAEDDYLKIEILKKIIYYDTEIYSVRITNKTDYTIVLADRTENSEISINLGEQAREISNLTYGNIVIWAGESKTRTFEFTKFYDDGVDTKSMIFNAVRVLQSYSGNESTRQNELDNAIKLYSITLPI